MKKIILIGHADCGTAMVRKILNQLPKTHIDGEVFHPSPNIRNKQGQFFDPEKQDAIAFLQKLFKDKQKEKMVGVCLSAHLITGPGTEAFYVRLLDAFDDLYFIHLQNDSCPSGADHQNDAFYRSFFGNKKYLGIKISDLNSEPENTLKKISGLIDINENLYLYKNTKKIVLNEINIIINNDSMMIGDYKFIFDVSNKKINKKNPEKIFIMMKRKRLVELYIDMFNQNTINNLFELGIREGGSVAFYNLAFRPQKHTAIDLSTHIIATLNDVIKQAKSEQRSLSTHYGVDQANRDRLLSICKKAFDYSNDNPQPLDCVVDDASHMQRPTEASFEALFPLLRKDGLYAIEDWGWAHWDGFQGPTGIFADEPALTNTIFKLLILHTCRPDIISEIRITPVVAFIRRGPAALQSGSFSIDKLLVMRDKELPAI